MSTPDLSGDEDSNKNTQQICCLMDDDVKCTKVTGNASYNKRIETMVQTRRLKLSISQRVQHTYICDHHKNMIQNVRSKRKRRESDGEGESGDNEYDCLEPDFYHMHVDVLRRYKRHYKLQAKSGLSKAQLSDIVGRHFKNIPVVEKEALTYFICMVKTHKSRHDKPLESPS